MPHLSITPTQSEYAHTPLHEQHNSGVPAASYPCITGEGEGQKKEPFSILEI